MMRQEVVRETRSGELRDGRFRKQHFREIRKIGSSACRCLIGIPSMGSTTDLDMKYRDFGHNMVGYLELQGAKYNTDQEDALECLMETQSGK